MPDTLVVLGVTAGILLALYIFPPSVGQKCPRGRCGSRVTIRRIKTDGRAFCDEERKLRKKKTHLLHCFKCHEESVVEEEWVLIDAP